MGKLQFVDIIKTIMQAPKMEQPSQEDLEAIINTVHILFLFSITSIEQH